MKMTLNTTFMKNTVKGINDKKFRWNSNPVYIWFTWDGVVLYEIDNNKEIVDYFESKGVPRSETLNTTHIIENARVVLDDNDRIIHSSYERHLAMIRQKTEEVMRGIIDKFDIKELTQ